MKDIKVFSLEVGNYVLPGVYLCPCLDKWGKLVHSVAKTCSRMHSFSYQKGIGPFYEPKKNVLYGHERDVNVIEWSFHIPST